jgi:hypothetical protein
MESKLHGDLLVTLYEMAQDVRSTYQNSIHTGTRESQALSRVALYHLDASIQALMKLSGEEVSTRTEQSSST